MAFGWGDRPLGVVLVIILMILIILMPLKVKELKESETTLSEERVWKQVPEYVYTYKEALEVSKTKVVE